MSKSFFPKSDAKLSVWASNYKSKISNYAGQLSLTPEQVDKESSYCDQLIKSINEVANKKNLLKSSIQEKNNVISMDGGALRADINNIKTLPGYTDVIGEDLGIISHTPSVDFANYKAVITVEIHGGIIQTKFKKMDADGVNIYRRKKGAVDWLFLARATHSPFEQTFVLDIPGQPEIWEYRAYGVVLDNEVGYPSDIIEVVYAQ